MSTPSVAAQRDRVTPVEPPTDASALAEETCPNCGAQRLGDYCQDCGQHYLRRRLTMKLLWREFTERFLKLERGLLRTVREMTFDPAGLISRYVGGQRRSYLNPFSYLVLSSVLLVIVIQVTGFTEEMAAYARNTMYDQMAAAGNSVPPAFIQLYTDFIAGLSKNSLYTTLGMALPFALLLKLFFYRSPYNVAEHFVFVLFTFAQVGLVIALLYLLRWTFGLEVHAMVYSAVASLLYFGICSYTAWKLHKEGIFAVFKVTGGLLISYGIVMVVIFAGFFAYLILFPNPLRGAGEWTLLEAAEQNALPVAQRMLADGTDASEGTGLTPLHVAAEAGHLQMTELLLQYGADARARDRQGRDPLIIAVHADHPEIARALLEADPEPNVIKSNGNSTLIEAINHGYPDIARWLVDQGAEVNVVRDNERATALMCATYEEDVASVKLLLENGADPMLTNEAGETALDIADNEEIASLLRAAMAPPADPVAE